MYQIIREIGHGGMGCVYEALNPQGKRVALKKVNNTITCNPEVRDLFITESNSLRKMHHPGVVSICGEPYSDPEGNFYLPMDFVEGETIQSHVQRCGAYGEQEALALMDKILDAFGYIHSQDCIHRDIKPSNIMVRPDGSICIIDFGIAKDAKLSTGKTIGRIIGTDGYMSPEQANGYSIDKRTDIYSLGCLLHFMLTGQHAVTKKTNDYETVMSILNDAFPSARAINPAVSQHTQDVIFRAVDKNMTHRFQTTEEFRRALSGGMPNANSGSSKVITIGRGMGNSILVPSTNVSRNHARIIANGNSLTYEDTSSNGTVINGRKINHQTIPIRRGDKILLAGTVELDWNQINGFLGRETIITPPTEPDRPYVPEPDTASDKLGTVPTIISFLFPIIGIILYFCNKKSKPNKAKSAITAAAIGFALNIIISIISNSL